jgi:predicted flap endonuclease-1-like 5' DNA nuclease
VEPDSIPLETHSEVADPSGGEGVTALESAGSPEILSPERTAVNAGQDDLTIIEGIGPKIAGLLREAGITTFWQLAGASIGRLDEILTNARLRRLADPATWPEQARLASENKMDDLLELQRSLKAGRRVSST